MMKLKYRIVLCAVLCVLTQVPCDAFWPFRKKKHTEEKEAVVLSPYQRFVGKKSLQKVESFLTLYRDGGDLYFEIPDSLTGRKIAISAMVEECSDPRLSLWDDISSKRSFVIDITDSLVLLRRAQPALLTDPADGNMASALSKNRISPVRFAMPILYRNADSSAVVVKVNSLFDYNDAELVTFRRAVYNGASTAGAKFSSKETSISDIAGGNGYVLVRKPFSANVGVVGFLGGVDASSRVSGRMGIRYSLVGQNIAAPKRYDSRMGVASRQIMEVSSDSPFYNHRYALRWDLSGDKKVVMYVDTLLQGPYRRAVVDALNAWDKAFVKAGLGNRVEVRDMSAGVDILDPCVSCVVLNGSDYEDVSSWRYVPDGSQIVACRINIPRGLKQGIYRNASSRIGDTDVRWLKTDLPESAVYDYLYMEILRNFGKCLGLEVNYAAATAYAPAQLRNPDFTELNGICPSAMASTRFNLFASEKQIEDGAVVSVDRVGDWDSYTLSWLYDGNGFEFRDDVLFIPYQKTQCDYRGINDEKLAYNIIGNDPFAYADAVFEHTKNILAGSADFVLNSDSRFVEELFVDFLWMNMFQSTAYLRAYIGGMKVSDMHIGMTEAKYTALPADVQKKAARKLCDQVDRLQELNRYCRPLITIAGTNKDFTLMNMQSKANLFTFKYILPRIRMASELGGSTFTPKDYIDMAVTYICKDSSSYALEMTVHILASMNNTCFNRYLLAKNPKDPKALADASALPDGVSIAYASDYPIWSIYGLECMKKHVDRDKFKYIYYLVCCSLGEN